jgi:WD40 repeat protein
MFDPTANRFASAGSDGVVRVWDADTGREVLALHGHHRAAIAGSPRPA